MNAIHYFCLVKYINMSKLVTYLISHMHGKKISISLIWKGQDFNVFPTMSYVATTNKSAFLACFANSNPNPGISIKPSKQIYFRGDQIQSGKTPFESCLLERCRTLILTWTPKPAK